MGSVGLGRMLGEPQYSAARDHLFVGQAQLFDVIGKRHACL